MIRVIWAGHLVPRETTEAVGAEGLGSLEMEEAEVVGDIGMTDGTSCTDLSFGLSYGVSGIKYQSRASWSFGLSCMNASLFLHIVMVLTGHADA